MSEGREGAGLKFTQRIAHELGETCFAIVSGLARGIDAAAHRASLESGTIAMLAGGQNRVSFRPSMRICLTPSCRPVRRCPKCRSAGSREAAIFRAVTD